MSDFRFLSVQSWIYSVQTVVRLSKHLSRLHPWGVCPCTSRNTRVLGILCMGHVFNFAILGIPSSKIRNHPWKSQACTSAGTCSKETPCLQCKMSKSHWLWSFYIVNRGFLCYMFLHLYRPETFRDGSLWYWREFPIWRNWIHDPCTEYLTP